MSGEIDPQIEAKNLLLGLESYDGNDFAFSIGNNFARTVHVSVDNLLQSRMAEQFDIDGEYQLETAEGVSVEFQESITNQKIGKSNIRTVKHIIVLRNFEFFDRQFSKVKLLSNRTDVTPSISNQAEIQYENAYAEFFEFDDDNPMEAFFFELGKKSGIETFRESMFGDKIIFSDSKYFPKIQDVIRIAPDAIDAVTEALDNVEIVGQSKLIKPESKSNNQEKRSKIAKFIRDQKLTYKALIDWVKGKS